VAAVKREAADAERRFLSRGGAAVRDIECLRERGTQQGKREKNWLQDRLGITRLL
jgi:hypothetical protein